MTVSFHRKTATPAPENMQHRESENYAPRKPPNFTTTGFALCVLTRCCAERRGRGVEEEEKEEKMRVRKRESGRKK